MAVVMIEKRKLMESRERFYERNRNQTFYLRHKEGKIRCTSDLIAHYHKGAKPDSVHGETRAGQEMGIFRTRHNYYFENKTLYFGNDTEDYALLDVFGSAREIMDHLIEVLLDGVIAIEVNHLAVEDALESKSPMASRLKAIKREFDAPVALLDSPRKLLHLLKKEEDRAAILILLEDAGGNDVRLREWREVLMAVCQRKKVSLLLEKEGVLSRVTGKVSPIAGMLRAG